MSVINKKSIRLLNLCPQIYAHVSKRLAHFWMLEFSARFVKQNYVRKNKIVFNATDCQCCMFVWTK
jgi:hypothetical protein